MTAKFSSETMEARRIQHKIFPELKEKNIQPRIVELAKISFRNKGKSRYSQVKEN